MSAVLTLLLMAAMDGGAAVPKTAVVSPADQELIDNLELLESLDEAKELDLLHELSVEQ